MRSRRKMNIILHMGVLANSNINFGEKSNSGGPLGELLQWTDLIACLFLLGHNLYISTDRTTLFQHLELFPLDFPCPNIHQDVDLIITDILGLVSFKIRREYLVHHKCRIRLLDSFGTHVEFNYKSYFDAHKGDLAMKGTASGNPWGGNELKLLQFWTFFPHTPDNDFLGFAIHKSNVTPMFERNSRGRAVSLIYGKEKYMWSGSEAVLNVLKNFTEVHATVADAQDSSGIFSNVTNHGFLNGSSIAALLRSCNIFFGLGFPLEGPAPLEALAHGAVFINPKFIPPKSRLNMDFLHEKPTLREFTSQSPYLERFGRPHIYTVDFSNTSALRNAIIQAIKEKPDPFVPEEFTPEGMLIRVHVLISRNLCSDVSDWPPHHAFLPKLGNPNKSCVEVCQASNLVCEPSYFPLINTATLMESIAGCSPFQLINSTEPFAPFKCSLQSDSSMYSCATRPPAGKGILRICPCRDYLLEQVAFCRNCVS
ncbi:Gly-2p [Parelaphostrongylus tenuis]|uniref:alpha-1,6-mannosyl-glycoprotein 6-beta-N-acetylglucosaminyltransferase n=1 Tax=Parelaphostrongylus tenuis TaxID=148309 RepID=A0AAD5N3G6_PARTN|nr:Gly-2p [Parelaphostrongylus tenuis]